MGLSLINLGIIFFVMWMIYFSLGAFASMTEDKLLLNIFRSFKYIIGIISIILIILYIFY